MGEYQILDINAYGNNDFNYFTYSCRIG